MNSKQPHELWQEWMNQSSDWLRQNMSNPGMTGMAQMPGMGQMPDWSQALQQFQNMGAQGLPAMGQGGIPHMSIAPDKLLKLQQDYVREATDLWNQSLKSSTPVRDKRFAGAAWQENPLASYSAALYLLNARTLMAMAEAAEGDAKTKARLRFAVEQWMAAAAPSNFLAFNVEAQKKAIETRGESLSQGLQNLLSDMRRGQVSMTDESVFEVGKNVATSEGAVVFENDLFQLIEYKPLTTKVHERPFLLVPPCINKYYILDLQPENSLIRYAVNQGMRTFVVSWRNPDESLQHKTWDDYVEEGGVQAVKTVQAIAGSKQINALGFCVGGTILTTALAVLAARGDKPVSALTLLTSLLDYTHTGVLDVFIDEQVIQYRDAEMGKGGLMRGRDMAATFSFLRPNDLVWNYVVGNYLKGETPPPFDLLYWNSDSTNLPGPFYVWYLRNLYLENRLVKPGQAEVCGVKIDLGLLDMPVFIYGSREDHIVPIDGAYASTQFMPGEKRFVMGSSGHIAGVINPPAANKRSHWRRDDGEFPAQLSDWVAGATEYPGSWWTDWSDWLKSHAGKQVAAPKSYGKGKSFEAIEPAPGRYVKQKA